MFKPQTLIAFTACLGMMTCWEHANYALTLQRQFMSLVGQYDMDLFTAIFSLLYVPVPDFHLGDFYPVDVGNPPYPARTNIGCCLAYVTSQDMLQLSGDKWRMYMFLGFQLAASSPSWYLLLQHSGFAHP